VDLIINNKGEFMKKLISLVMLVSLISCGDKVHNYAPTEEPRVFDGYFLLDGPSDTNCIRLTQKFEHLVDLESECQNLLTINPQNDTIGQFPRISATNLVVIDGEIRFTRDLNFTSGQDVEEDVNGSNITGRKRVDFLIKVVEGKLIMKISVFANQNNANLNEIVATRQFKEL
jgi:hypothetical protein